MAAAEPIPLLRRAGHPGTGGREFLREHEANELVFAVVGYTGSGTSDVARVLKNLMASSKVSGGPYEVVHLKARDVIVEWAFRNGRIPAGHGFERGNLQHTTLLQDLGDDMRRGDPTAVAQALVDRIRRARAASQGIQNPGLKVIRPDGKPRAYINAIADDLIDLLPQLEALGEQLQEALRQQINGLGEQLREQLRMQFRRSRVGGLLEFSRAVHAEMDALLSAARKGGSTQGCRLFVTTFPCHYCARHIVGAGVDEVQYIEPYPKSLALDLHRDSIVHSIRDWKPPSEGGKKVLFRPFTGVAPQLYRRAFLKDRELKSDIDGGMQFGQPDWGTAWNASKLSYAELEAKLLEEEAHG